MLFVRNSSPKPEMVEDFRAVILKHYRHPNTRMPKEVLLGSFTAALTQIALERSKGNKAMAGRLINMNRNTFYKAISSHRLNLPDILNMKTS